MKVYCPYCSKDVTYTVRKKLVSEYKGVKIRVQENVGVCSKCKNDLFIPEFYNEALKKITRAYSTKANIISASDIISLREKYNLSQRELTSILGFGKMTINRYESGSLPSKSQSDYIRLLIENENKFIEKTKEALKDKRITNKTYNKVVNEDTIISSGRCEVNDEIRSYLESLFVKDLNEFNGYQEFDINKLENIISYIASKVKNLTITSINKYLWYIDMLSFKERTVSITGLTYDKDKFGPIIIEKSYDMITLLDDLYERHCYENEYGSVTKIESKNNFNLEKLKENEIDIIDRVIKKLKNKNVSEISNLSHEEEAYKKTKMYEAIPFEYAMNLKLL